MKTIALLIVVSSAFVILSLPSLSNAQTDPGLLSAIRGIIDEAFGKLSKEVQSLRGEVQTLRAELRQLQKRGPEPTPFPIMPPAPKPAPLTKALNQGDSGSEVEHLQRVLIYLGFDVPAGITGNFSTQTQRALSQVQTKYRLTVTGSLDQATLTLLNSLLYPMTVAPEPTPPPKPEPKPEPEPKPKPEQPIITPKLILLSPNDGMMVNAGAKTPITWKTSYAPAGSKVLFRVTNKLYGMKKTILETEELSGTYEWTLPDNWPSDNEFVAELVYKEEDAAQIVLASRSIIITLIGAKTQTTTNTPTTSTKTGDVDFYKGTAFTGCMAAYPETIKLISSWLDQGLQRYQFPWSQITGSAANKVAECEGNTFQDGNYQYYSCTSNTTQSTCSAQSGCKWFDTFCGDQNYNPDSSGGGTSGTASGMSRCFYPNASVNGQAPGYTVWCEKDYYNCRVGEPNGASVSLEGLMLGSPSTCETGWNNNYGPSQTCTGTTQSSCTSVSNCYWKAEGSYCYYDSSGPITEAKRSSLASVIDALSSMLKGLQTALRF